MSKVRIATVTSLIAVVCAFPGVAYAQVSRTWVSGLGDDLNPCSRTAPCRTFAGALPKTLELGEINTLDPGAYGIVTINKSITIDATAGLGGMMPPAAANAVIIDAGASDVVILRNLDLNGWGNGFRGIRILQAGDVRIENCKIYGFTVRGIEDVRSTGSLAVTDTVVSNNGQTGILALASSFSSLTIHLERVEMHHNGNSGFAMSNGGTAIVSHSSATSNGAHGFYADGGGFLNVHDSVSAGNVSSGVSSISGATVTLSSTTITGNGAALNFTPGSQILSYGTNRIVGNFLNNGPPTGTIAPQ